MSGKYVIGCGISGLVFVYYNREYRIITTDVGGKLQKEWMSSTIILHDTPATRALLSDLRIKAAPTAHIIKYCYQGRLLDVPSVQMLETLARKKLTVCRSLPTLDDTPVASGFEYAPTAGTHLKRLDVQASQLVAALKDELKDSITLDKIVEVTPTELVVASGRRRLPYVQLVSTLAAPIFWKMYHSQANQPPELRFRPVTYVYSSTPPPNTNGSTWDLIYYVDPIIPFTRVNRVLNTTNFLYEFTGDLSRDDVERLRPTLLINDHSVNPYDVVISDNNNIAPPNVRFLGRHAEWNHRIHIHDVIHEAQTERDFASVWNSQKAFNAMFFNFNVENLQFRQKLTRDFILHITDEAHELLHATHWKGEKFLDEAADRERVLEEWIDVFKWWLGLGNVWGFTIDDFFREFWRKSLQVEAKYTPDDIKRIRKSFTVFLISHASRPKRPNKPKTG